MSNCCEQNLKPLADGCVCPGSSLQLTCTAVGGVATVWTIGRQCSESLSLQHLQFTTGVTRSCDSPAATGSSLSVNVVDGCYTSQLTIAVTTDLNGMNVTCERDSGVNTESIGTYQINLTSGKKILMSLNSFMTHDFPY